MVFVAVAPTSLRAISLVGVVEAKVLESKLIIPVLLLVLLYLFRFD